MTANDPPSPTPMERARSLAGRAKRKVQRGVPVEVTDRLNRQHERIAATERDLARIGPQVAALEARFERMRQRLDAPDLDLDDATRSEARSIVEEVRREHEQVRARISAAVRYEERLRQLEEQVAKLAVQG